MVRNLALLELFSILVAVVIWDLFRERLFSVLVLAINQLSLSLPPVVKLLQRLVFVPECMSHGTACSGHLQGHS